MVFKRNGLQWLYEPIWSVSYRLKQLFSISTMSRNTQYDSTNQVLTFIIQVLLEDLFRAKADLIVRTAPLPCHWISPELKRLLSTAKSVWYCEPNRFWLYACILFSFIKQHMECKITHTTVVQIEVSCHLSDFYTYLYSSIDMTNVQNLHGVWIKMESM